MLTPTSSEPPAPPPIPESTDPLIHSAETPNFEQSKKMSNSPFAAMFKGGASDEDVQKFINGILKTISREIKRTQERWEKSQRRIRRIMAGQVPDE